MELILKKDSVLNQKTDAIINSANNFLFHRTGTAEQIREKSGKLNKKEKEELKILLSKIPIYAKKFFKEKFEKQYNPNFQSTISSMKLLLKNKGEFKRGKAILDKNWSKKDKTPLINLVLIRHVLLKENYKIKKAKPRILRKALKRAFKIISKNNYQSIAIPVMVARGDYGLNPKQSLNIIKSSVKKFSKKTKLKKIIICFDNEKTKEYFDSLKK